MEANTAAIVSLTQISVHSDLWREITSSRLPFSCRRRVTMRLDSVLFYMIIDDLRLQLLPPGSICVLLFVISWRYRLTASARTVVGPSQLPARRRGTHCQTHLRRVENSTAAFGRLLKTHLFSEYYSVYSTLGVSAIMRYIDRHFTYLLTYLQRSVMKCISE